MTITLTKTKLAVALLALVMVVPATAWATHTFSDVEDGEFYSDAVTWAFDNNITTGTSATTFSPLDNVTRGQSVTFAKRYDDNIVQPALTTLTASAATNAAGIAAQPSLFWAVVDTDGTLVRGSTGASSANVGPGAGRYQVDVGADVTGCAYVGSPGDPADGAETDRILTTASRTGNVNAVFVNMEDLTGTNIDAQFHLMVIC